MTTCNLQHAFVKLPEQQFFYVAPCTSRGECSRTSFICHWGFHVLPNTPQKFYGHILCQQHFWFKWRQQTLQRSNQVFLHDRLIWHAKGPWSYLASLTLPVQPRECFFVALLVFLTVPFTFMFYFLRADPHLSYTNTVYKGKQPRPELAVLLIFKLPPSLPPKVKC